MEQLEIILGNYDKRRDQTPKITENGKDDIKEQIRATVLEASKSF